MIGKNLVANRHIGTYISVVFENIPSFHKLIYLFLM